MKLRLLGLAVIVAVAVVGYAVPAEADDVRFVGKSGNTPRFILCICFGSPNTATVKLPDGTVLCRNAPIGPNPAGPGVGFICDIPGRGSIRFGIVRTPAGLKWSVQVGGRVICGRLCRVP